MYQQLQHRIRLMTRKLGQPGSAFLLTQVPHREAKAKGPA